MNHETTLLPCPFCGGEAEIDLYTIKPYVSCTKCGCSMPDRHQTAEQAIEAWNTRAEFDGIPMTDENMAKHGWVRERTCEMETDWDYLHDGIPDAPEDTWAYMCSACEWSFRYDRGIKPTYCPNCGAKVVDR